MNDDGPDTKLMIEVPCCRKCGSKDLRPIVDPRSNRLYRNFKRYLAICYSCGETSTVEESEVHLLLWFPGHEESHVRCTICHHCGYDIRGLSIEDKCPECGLTILTERVVSSHLVGLHVPSYPLVAALLVMFGAMQIVLFTGTMSAGI